jgi:cytoskeletal protein CcmA (bactofilin family)
MWYRRQEERPISPPTNPAEPSPRPPAVAEAPVEAPGRSESRVPRNLRIKGEVQGGEDLRVDGRIEGPVRLTGGRMTVGEGGAVSGPIEARAIVVLGEVRGTLRAADRIEIGAAGVLYGDLFAPRLRIVEGAQMRGRVVTGPEEEPRKRRGHDPRASKPDLFPVPGGKPHAGEQ